MSTADAIALTPAQRAQVAARDRLRGLGEVEVLREWYRGADSFDLTDAEDRIRRRWDFAKAQFLGLSTYGEVVTALQKEFEVSVAQARIDVRNMRHAFGNLDEVPKAIHRERAIEMALRAYKIAEAKQDSDGMAKATKTYIIAAGIDKDDPDRVDMEKLMSQRLYVDALDPVVRNFLLNFLKNTGGSADASALFEKVHDGAQEGDFVDYELIDPLPVAEGQ